ncbi:MAG: NAD(P)-dependent oxidoreductase [Planctomycetota bacterium]
MAQRVGVIGYGIVGKAVRHVFSPFSDEIMIYDKYKESAELAEVVDGSDFLFLCVPPPNLAE